MNEWAWHARDLLDGGGESLGCTHPDHAVHLSRKVRVVLDGEHHGIKDYPPIPHALARSFDMNVWDWQQYQGTTGYCPGNDIISECIETQGVWEGYATNLVLDILLNYDDPLLDHVVVDVGSQIGWYTMLALKCGYDVLAIDADPACHAMTMHNAFVNGHYQHCHAARHTLTSDTPELPVVDARLVKMDVEGAEHHAVRMMERSLVARSIDFLLIEVSPCFDDYYPDLISRFVDDLRYECYVLPDKGHKLEEYGRSPLLTLYEDGPMDRYTLRAEIASWRQKDVLLVKEELVP